eukprot:6894271-Prymnesium_polylepis.1
MLLEEVAALFFQAEGVGRSTQQQPQLWRRGPSPRDCGLCEEAVFAATSLWLGAGRLAGVCHHSDNGQHVVLDHNVL